MGNTYIYITNDGCGAPTPPPPSTPPTGQNTGYAWVYVINGGTEPRIQRASDAGISVRRIQPGEYVVTFAPEIKELVCTATLNNSVGAITAVPGDNSGLQPNEVRVLTLNLDNSFGGGFDFTLTVFYPLTPD